MKFNPLGLFHPKYLNLFLTRCSVFKDQTFHSVAHFRSQQQLLYLIIFEPTLQELFFKKFFPSKPVLLVSRPLNILFNWPE